MSSTSAGATGGALTIVFNYIIGVLYQVGHNWLPVIAAPSAEFLGSEQLLVTIIFTHWAAQKGITLNGNGSYTPSQPSLTVEDIKKSVKADAASVAALVTAPAPAVPPLAVSPAPPAPTQAKV